MSTTDRAAPSPVAPASPEALPREITIAVSSLADLFNAPTVNPLVDRDLRALGEPALVRAVRVLQVSGMWDRRPVRLHVQIADGQLTGDAAASLAGEAIHRYCTAKIAENAMRIRLVRRRASMGLVISLVLVLLLCLLAYLLLVTLLAQAGTVVQAIVVGSVSVFAWVVLWDTLEALIFEPIPATFENRALARLAQADVVVDSIPARAR